jgi:hypothetical protein
MNSRFLGGTTGMICIPKVTMNIPKFPLTRSEGRFRFWNTSRLVTYFD